MAFRNKADAILALGPDILIVPECEHPDKLIFGQKTKKPGNILWFGTNKHKGLGIFSYCDLRFSVMNSHKPEFRMIIPVSVTGLQHSFTLYAVWANNPADPDGHYIEQVWKALDCYEKQLTGNQTILAGDFNSNTIWDRKYRVSNHSNVVKRLEEKGIYSCYHHYHKQVQGQEQHPTLYMYRHKDKPYHIDYCFASGDLLQKLQDVEVGSFDVWSKYSDHVPLITTFAF
jgi:exonuclease III